MSMETRFGIAIDYDKSDINEIIPCIILAGASFSKFFDFYHNVTGNDFVKRYHRSLSAPTFVFSVGEDLEAIYMDSTDEGSMDEDSDLKDMAI